MRRKNYEHFVWKTSVGHQSDLEGDLSTTRERHLLLLLLSFFLCDGMSMLIEVVCPCSQVKFSPTKHPRIQRKVSIVTIDFE